MLRLTAGLGRVLLVCWLALCLNGVVIAASAHALSHLPAGPAVTQLSGDDGGGAACPECVALAVCAAFLLACWALPTLRLHRWRVRGVTSLIQCSACAVIARARAPPVLS